MSDPAVKLDRFDANPFLDGPSEFISKTVARVLAEVPQWAAIFGEYIDAYKRTDYPLGAFPALRIYDNGYRKDSESWFIDGTLFLDVIWPPSIRRVESQQLQDTVAAAMLQQFRRITLFNTVENATQDSDANREGFKLLGVPGLNQLGRTFMVDKALGFQLSDNPQEIAPLTQIQVNFRVDLRVWDQYLEDNLRTKDDPFEQTLGELTRLVGTIAALRDDGTSENGIIAQTDHVPGEE